MTNTAGGTCTRKSPDPLSTGVSPVPKTGASTCFATAADERGPVQMGRLPPWFTERVDYHGPRIIFIRPPFFSEKRLDIWLFLVNTCRTRTKKSCLAASRISGVVLTRVSGRHQTV